MTADPAPGGGLSGGPSGGPSGSLSGGPSGAGLPDNAYAAVVAALPDMTPARLRRLLHDRPARLAHGELRAGDPSLLERLVDPEGEAAGAAAGHARRLERARMYARWWTEELNARSVEGTWASLRAQSIGVVRLGDEHYPRGLLRLPDPPELLYVRGELVSAAGPAVGIVGTRRATHYGSGVAGEFGAELAGRGATIVSGMALGVDAAAHSGAFTRAVSGAAPIAVLAGGVDVVYPPRNRALYHKLVESGAVVSEAPPGTAPVSWRFPLRNRIIAGLSAVLVVVESSRQGGSMLTVEAADRIGVPVLAVPGSIRSPQSEGTNLLIAQGGAHPALDVGDVMAALVQVAGDEARLFDPVSVSVGRRGGRAGRDGGGRSQSTSGGRLDREAVDRVLSRCSPHERAVYRLLSDDVTQVDTLCEATSSPLRDVVLALDRLSELGLAQPHGAGWVRR